MNLFLLFLYNFNYIKSHRLKWKEIESNEDDEYNKHNYNNHCKIKIIEPETAKRLSATVLFFHLTW